MGKDPRLRWRVENALREEALSSGPPRRSLREALSSEFLSHRAALAEEKRTSAALVTRVAHERPAFSLSLSLSLARATRDNERAL